MSSKFYKQSNPQAAPSQNPSDPKPIPSKAPIEQQRLPILPTDNIESSGIIMPVIKASSHPILSLLHLSMKVATVVVFVVFPLFSSSFYIKEIVIILAALDFWIVKNVTGRLLVGLRWWVDFQENGDQRWKFQCKVNEKNVNAADDKIFWWTLALFCLVWLLLSIANILSLNITNLIISIFCLAMLGFNLFSYYRCSKAQSQNLKKLAVQYGADVAAKFMTGSIIANYF